MALQTKIKGEKVNVGDLIRVFTRLIEGEKSRLVVFEGLVIAIKGREENKTFVVRKIASAGVGVERIWPVSSPWIEKIEIKKRGKVRRSKLYYLRERKGKAALKVRTKEVKRKTSEKKETRKTRGKTGRKTSSK